MKLSTSSNPAEHRVAAPSRRQKALHFKDVLRARRTGSAELLKHANLVVDGSGDQADEAVRETIQTESGPLIQLQVRIAGEVDDALERMENGRYGICKGCDGKIAEARLNAVPYTCYCIGCQKENEKSEQPLYPRKPQVLPDSESIN